MLDTDTDQSLFLSYIYQSQIAIVVIGPGGEVEMMTPMAAQWLMPLAPKGHIDNLFIPGFTPVGIGARLCLGRARTARAAQAEPQHDPAAQRRQRDRRGCVQPGGDLPVRQHLA